MSHSSKSISLSEYLDRINQQEVRIPEFQRPFVWTEKQMKALAASLLKGYPIGSFLLMEDTGAYSSKSILKNEDKENNSTNALLVLDGQQRTISIHQLFSVVDSKEAFKFYFRFENFTDDVKDLDIKNADSIIDKIEEKIEEEWLIAYKIGHKDNPKNFNDQVSRGLLPLNMIFSDSNDEIGYTGWINTYFELHKDDLELQKNRNKYQRILDKYLIQNLISYQLSEIVIDKHTRPSVICTIFETINSTGQSLTILDLLNAKCFGKGFYLREELKQLFEKEELFNAFAGKKENKEDYIGLMIIRIISLMCTGSCKKSKLLNLKAEEIEKNWKNAVKAIRKALNYIKKHYGILGIKYFPYKDMLSAIALICSSDKFVDKNCENKLDQWYWNAVFSEHFNSTPESKIDKVIREFLGSGDKVGWFEDDSLVPDVVKNKGYINDLESNLDKLTSTHSAVYKAIFNLVILNGAVDFSKDRVSLYSLDEAELQDHHIYPKKFLSYDFKEKDEKYKINTILNRTLISVKANKKISDNQPKVYFKKEQIIGSTPFEEDDYKGHFIDSKIVNQQYDMESFNKFKQARKEMIMEEIRNRI